MISKDVSKKDTMLTCLFTSLVEIQIASPVFKFSRGEFTDEVWGWVLRILLFSCHEVRLFSSRINPSTLKIEVNLRLSARDLRANVFISLRKNKPPSSFRKISIVVSYYQAFDNIIRLRSMMLCNIC